MSIRSHTPSLESGNPVAQPSVGRIYSLCFVVIIASLFCHRYVFSEILPEELQQAAEQGSDVAQLELGYMYYDGKGVPKDLAAAARWFRKAADQGNDAAQGRLGYMYYNGEGVPKDLAVAARWFRKAADQGDDAAQVMLGGMYYKGEGVPKDLVAAARWYREAADRGNDFAQAALGYMYYKGEGVPKNLAAAARWYRKAADRGNDFAQAALGYMYYYGEGVPKNLAAAARWYRKAANQGNDFAQAALGYMYYYGEGVPKNLAAAARWYRKAANQGNDFAQAALGYMYQKGEWVPKDLVAAARWYRKAANQGNEVAQFKLGYMYYYGEGVPKDYLLSYAWSSLAAAQGQKYAKDIRDSLERIMTPNQIAEAQRISRRIDAQIASGEKPEMFFHLNRVKQQPVSSGSGFLVGTRGEILTNYHVINKCNRLTVNHGGTEHSATVKTGDETNDLALLVAQSVKGFVSTLSVSPQIRLGEIVQVAGYPLSGILSNDLNITSGNVSALAGLANNVTHLQITAPIQPGNSGGPLLDETGNVVGIVVSQLNAIETARYTGSLPQNVNFAIKVSVVRMFLENHGVTYRRGTSDSKISPEKIAGLARGFTVAVQCW